MRSNQLREADRQTAALRLLFVGSSRGTLSFQIAPISKFKTHTSPLFRWKRYQNDAL